MANRIFLFVSVVLATLTLAATSARAAPAADECLARPKGPAPAGKHWYYRTNRTIQRKCWFLGDEGWKTVAVKPPKQRVAAATADPEPEISKTADARAELVDQPRPEQHAEQPVTLVAAPQPVAPPQPPPEASQPVPDNMDNVTTRSWTLASRWPESADAFASNPATPIDDSAQVSQIETASPVMTAMPVAQPPATVADTRTVSSIPFAGAIFIVVISGAIVMLFASRRRQTAIALQTRGSYREHRPVRHTPIMRERA